MSGRGSGCRSTGSVSAARPRRPVTTSSWSLAGRCGGSPTASDDLALDLLAAHHRIGVRRTPQGLSLLLVGPPLHDDELGTHAQRTLRASYDGAEPVDRVLLESAGGRACSGSPLAVDAELARVRPDLERWWVVADHSVVVPPGTRAVVKHSRHWHEALAGARWVVTDGPLDPSFRRRAGQHVVRLAGYPATALAVQRWERLRFSDARIRRLVACGADQWTTLVVPNEAAESDFRAMFGYRGEVLATGLPGTDLLVGGDVVQRREATRIRLGIRPDQTAVLHARHLGDRATDGRRPVCAARPRASSATCSVTTTSCCSARSALGRRSSTRGCSTSATTPPRPT